MEAISDRRVKVYPLIDAVDHCCDAGVPAVGAQTKTATENCRKLSVQGLSNSDADDRFPTIPLQGESGLFHLHVHEGHSLLRTLVGGSATVILKSPSVMRILICTQTGSEHEFTNISNLVLRPHF